jgi:hypothetical protein
MRAPVGVPALTGNSGTSQAAARSPTVAARTTEHRSASSSPPGGHGSPPARPACLRRQPPGQAPAPGRGRTARGSQHRLLHPDGTRRPRGRLRGGPRRRRERTATRRRRARALAGTSPFRPPSRSAPRPARPNHGPPSHPAGPRGDHRSTSLDPQRPPRHLRHEPTRPRALLAGPGLRRRRHDSQTRRQHHQVHLPRPSAREFFVDYDRMATDAAAMLRLEAGRNPHDKALITLVGELSTQSELFRQHWASHNVKFHRSGRKRLRHPAVGQLDLNFEAMELPPSPTCASASTPPTRAPPHPTDSNYLPAGPPPAPSTTPTRERLTTSADQPSPQRYLLLSAFNNATTAAD